MKKILSNLVPICLVILGFIGTIKNIAFAQVTSDGTVNTKVNQNGNVAEITGGEMRGNNLFHSFQNFSIPTGNEAFFDNANNISNIFSRVTGGNISNIDGAIRANGGASLFLINPAGIIFGEGASLDIGGSFYGSSASSILFENGEFSAADLENPPLLTINAPIGLGFRDQPGDIKVTDATLEVDTGEQLSFIGGNISFDGVSFIAPGGKFELGSLSTQGEVELSDDGSFNFAEGLARGDISLVNNTDVDVRAEGGGFIDVNARNLTLSGQSELLAGISENSNSPEAQAGDITINATESVKLIGEGFSFQPGVFNTETEVIASADKTAIRNNIGLPAIKRNNSNTRSNAQGNGGSIFINSKTLEISNFATVDAGIYGTGNGGNIAINAETIVLDTGNLQTDIRGANFVNLIEQGSGEPGDILITTNSLSLRNDASLIFTGLQKGTTGNAGDITINATDFVSVSGGDIRSSLLLTQIGSDSVGNAGDISITTSSLELSDGGLLLSDLDKGSIGNAGNIIIDATKTFSADGQSQIITQTQENSVGNAGNVSILAGSFNLTENSQIIANTNGNGNAGTITINTNDNIVIDDSKVLAEISENTLGNAGNIEISANSLEVTDESLIQTNTKSKGNAGDVKITVRDRFILDRSQILTQVVENAEGDAGNISILTESLRFGGNSQILANTNGNGNAGTININASDNIVIDESSLIQSQVLSNSMGNAGNIEISANSLEVTDESLIQATTGGKGNAGDVKIAVQDKFILDRAKILTQVFADAEGNAGNIEISADTLEFQNEASILADTNGQGNAGNIGITVGDKFSLNQNSFVLTQVGKQALQGNAGNIEIDAGSLELQGEAFILADTNGQGNAGNVTIQARDELNLSEGSLIGVGINQNAIGSSGDININASRILLTESGISSSTLGEGSSGDINISTNFISLEDFSFISASTGENSFNGGRVTVNAQALELTDGSNILTQTSGEGNAGDINLNISDRIVLNGQNTATNPPEFELFADPILNDLEGRTGILADADDNSIGNGGNIKIDTKFIIAFPNGNSDIVANAQQGNGGNIEINAESLFGIKNRPLSNATNDINAGSQFSLDGNVTISTPDINPIQGATQLPQNIVETEEAAAQTCQVNRETVAKNALTINGKGGIPPAPDLPLDSRHITINGELSNFASSIPQPIETSQGKIQPARGIKITESGKVTLTAYRTNNSGERILSYSANCNGIRKLPFNSDNM